MFNADTGEIISKMQRKTTIKITNPKGRTLLSVQMRQDGKRRRVYYNRLMYAIQHDIAYDDISKNLFVLKDENGQYQVIDKRGQMDICNKRVKATRKRMRIKRIDEKIHELEIMRRAYIEGSHIEAVQYIENRKNLLISYHSKKYGVSRENAEIRYNLALEWMIDRIDSDTSQVTNLTVGMMRMMNKVRAKLQAEQPLGLRNEIPSNSLTNKK